jgi:hypothetical protein
MLHVKRLEEAETCQTDEDQVDPDYDIEKARQDQDEDASDHGYDRLDVGCCDDHY